MWFPQEPIPLWESIHQQDPHQGQEWQTGKRVQDSAVMGLEYSEVATPQSPALSRLRGSETPEEFSFPPDARLMWAIDWHATWWHMSSAQQGSVVSTLVVSNTQM